MCRLRNIHNKISQLVLVPEERPPYHLTSEKVLANFLLIGGDEMPKFFWTGPFQIKSLLANCLNDKHPWPPAGNAVYLISRKPWKGTPNRSCGPLYVGGNTGKSERFRTRIGDLLADMHKFFSDETGHHSGGQTLHNWCKGNNVHPSDLFIAWAVRKPWCGRCAEIELFQFFIDRWEERHKVGLLNKKRPPWCKRHNKWID